MVFFLVFFLTYPIKQEFFPTPGTASGRWHSHLSSTQPAEAKQGRMCGPSGFQRSDIWTLREKSLGGGFKYCIFCFHPETLGKWSNLTNIFQLGWNHQLDPKDFQSKIWIHPLNLTVRPWKYAETQKEMNHLPTIHF